MNKRDLVEALAKRLGNRKTAAAALNAILAEIQSTVARGEPVSIAGFGVFEKRTRRVRTGPRSPRTGAIVKVETTSVPAFEAGTGFREMVARGRVPRTLVAKNAADADLARGHRRKAKANSKTTKATGSTFTVSASQTGIRARKAAKPIGSRRPAGQSTEAIPPGPPTGNGDG